MLGWDVSYVWPLLQGIVVTRVTENVDTQQIIMGFPRDAAVQTTSTNGSGTVAQTTYITDGPTLPSTGANHASPTQYDNSTRTSQHSRPTRIRIPRERSFSTDSTASDSRRPSFVDIRLFRLPRWPHRASSTFACLSCLLGMYNISRFALLVYIYKGSFIVQFLVLSAFIGIPLLFFLMVLGQYLGAGLLDMWYISPAFKGLGFAMLYIYVIMGIYSAVPLSWLFVYFKDSFITLKDSYKWGRCHYSFATNECLRALNSSAADYYGWSVPSYFHGRVLGRRPGEYHFGELRFEVAFNLCLVWVIVFLCLSRGPKTLGKVLYIIGTLPVILLLMITMRMGQQWGDGIKDIFMSPWQPTLADSSVWLLAAKEVFLTWGVLGFVIFHICSHNKMSTNLTKTLIAVVSSTVIVLITAAFLFSCTISVLHKKNLSLTGSSYEEEGLVRALKHGTEIPKNLSLSIMMIGDSLFPKDGLQQISGFQVLRLATEVFPGALAIEGVRSISSFWSICFYTAMILFGLGQQAVLWLCVVESIVSINYKVLKAWHATLTFLACNLAFLLGLPLTSNVGIYIMYYFDFCIGMMWWIIVIYLITLFIVLFIRGRPCGTEQLVKLIVHRPLVRSWILPLLTFQWNILLPVSLLALTISFLRASTMNSVSPLSIFQENYPYWPEWAKTVMFCIQVFPLMITIVTCTYQLFKVFLMKVDLPISERLRYLCCPTLPPPNSTFHQSLHSTSSVGQGSTNSAFIDDPPPKYTPPPSYSTATSRMLTKRLQSIALISEHIDTDSNSSICTIEGDNMCSDRNDCSVPSSSHVSPPNNSNT